jgi:hypothetical protein
MCYHNYLLHLALQCLHHYLAIILQYLEDHQVQHDEPASINAFKTCVNLH